MASSTKVWQNNNPPQVDDSDLNGFELENNNLISTSGQPLNVSDNFQTTKAVAIYVSSGNYYTDSGIANAYLLSPVGLKLSSPSYNEGMKVGFFPLNSNTGPSQINVNSLGVLDIKRQDGTDTQQGDIESGIFVELVLNSSNEFILLNTGTSVSQVPRRNFIIGGDFGSNLWNRLQSKVISGNQTGLPAYTADRWQVITNDIGSAVIQVDRNAVNSVIEGDYVIDSFKVTVNTPETVFGANPRATITYNVEGFDWSKFATGPFTISFLFITSVIGTYSLSLGNNGNDRSYVTEFSINSANTWIRIVKIIDAADLTGSWSYKGSIGLRMSISMIPDSNSTSTLDQWLTGNFRGSTNQINFFATGGNILEIDKLKIEGGTVFTGWDEPLIEEVWTLQNRYYQKTYQRGTNPGSAVDIGEQVHEVYYNAALANLIPNFIIYPDVLSGSASGNITLYSPATGNPNVINTSSGDLAAQAINESYRGFNIQITDVLPSIIQLLRWHYTVDSEIGD